ncbi:type IV secretion system protein [Sphingomonas sp. AOB5]|uniref:virB8 family protein n=1 Tax=Sphingomonas sp. AOB5 TaxID=3034017 RepID=UPI0023F7927A|nr:type IV secretion system protein [Sphingomonas sp. AOB5]MDF7777945.1 type IV secretion system protein [Sphingomonas sp. AOB5]
MKMKAREALDQYYEKAESWGVDQQETVRGSRRIAWIVAAVFGLIAVLEAFALYSLVPLKTVEPLTLLVDKQTGYVQALKPLEPAQIAGNTALTQSFLVQYVIAREGFDINAVQTNYTKVALWSEGTARAQYVSGMQASNPESPLARLPRTTVLETRVKSVSPMPNSSAMVRFETVRRDAGGQVSAVQAWVAVIKYRYSGEPMRIEDRYVNPLGFLVTSYQRNAEALPASQPAQPGAAAEAPAGDETAPGIVIPQGAQPTPRPRFVPPPDQPNYDPNPQ